MKTLESSRGFTTQLRLLLIPVVCSGLLMVTSGAQIPEELSVGHWVRIKGTMGEDLHIEAKKMEVLEPGDEHILIGRVRRLSADRLFVLGQVVFVSEKTRGLFEMDLSDPEARFKFTGFYRGPAKFSARGITPYRTPYDQVEGRIDGITERDGVLQLSVLKYAVSVRETVTLKVDAPLVGLQLAPLREFSTQVRERDDDDYIGSAYQFGPWRLGARITLESLLEDDFDLNSASESDRRDDELSLRIEAVYQPVGDFYGLIGLRSNHRWRNDEDDGRETQADTKVAEAFGYWRDLGLEGLDLQLGRQDFDEKREWLYDQNLDAARLIYRTGALRAEVSASTIVDQGSPRDENTNNLIAYLASRTDRRELAAYIVDRRDDRTLEDYPLHYGVRALGEWLPDHDMWFELAGLTGYRGTEDLRSFGYDLGTTWEPPFADDYYLSAGYAFGSGDDDPSDGADGAFRQTGLQDNNDKLAGVTSLRYYGELLDPELSNLAIFTLGVGRRFENDTSLELVYHSYAQDEAADSLFNAELNRKPDGIHTDLGWELDLVYGSRAYDDVDIKLVASMFDPGDAFSEQDNAYMAKIRVRFRF